jgi:hypothetical protein
VGFSDSVFTLMLMYYADLQTYMIDGRHASTNSTFNNDANVFQLPAPLLNITGFDTGQKNLSNTDQYAFLTQSL